MLIPIANPDQAPVKSTSTGFDVSGSHNILVWIRIHVRESQKHGYSDPDPQIFDLRRKETIFSFLYYTSTIVLYFGMAPDTINQV